MQFQPGEFYYLVKNNESPLGDGNAVKIGVSIKVRVIVKNNESPLGDRNFIT